MTPLSRARAERHAIRDYCRRRGWTDALRRHYQDQGEFIRALLARGRKRARISS